LIPGDSADPSRSGSGDSGLRLTNVRLDGGIGRFPLCEREPVLGVGLARAAEFLEGRPSQQAHPSDQRPPRVEAVYGEHLRLEAVEQLEGAVVVAQLIVDLRCDGSAI